MKIIRTLLIQDENIWLELALSCKRARDAFSPNLVGIIHEKYINYVDVIRDTNSELPESIFSIEENKQLKINFIDLYNKPTSKIKDLLILKRREHALTSCPYCGNPTIPDTLDHFIPKDLLAEYSIFPNNLVPQCRACAPIKGSKYFSNESNMVMFAHPFYSSLLDNVFIEITSSLHDNEVFFDIRFSINSQDEREQLAMILHIRTLRIKERILKYCDKEIKKWIRKLKKNRFDIKAVLTARFSEHDNDEVRSNWEFILYRSLLNNDAVMRFLGSIQPDEQQIEHNATELTVLDI